MCGKKGPKRDLHRVVASSAGRVVMDSTGKAPGRGAYVCRDGNCLQDGLKRGRLNYALRIDVSEEDWEDLVSSAQAVQTQR